MLAADGVRAISSVPRVWIPEGSTDRVKGVGDDVVIVHRLAFGAQLAQALLAEGALEDGSGLSAQLGHERGRARRRAAGRETLELTECSRRGASTAGTSRRAAPWNTAADSGRPGPERERRR